MNNSENNFGDLKRLLKLKRQEVPPPGYFNNFSDQVIARIRAGDGGGSQTLNERFHESVPWLANFLQIFDAKPGLIGGLAVCLCLLLVFGVVLAERPDSTPENILTVAQTATPAAPALNSTPAPALALADSDHQSGISVSTNPVISLQPVATLFGQQNPLFQTASFAPAGN